jgi:adenylate cyclase
VISWPAKHLPSCGEGPNLKNFLERLLDYSVSASSFRQGEDLRLRKKIFLAGVGTNFYISLVAGALFAFWGLWIGSEIAWGVCALDVVMVVVFFYSKRAFPVLLHAHNFLNLIFPFVTQSFLGGFAQTGGLGLWAVVAPLVAVFLEMPMAWLWLAAFVGLEWGSLVTEKYWLLHGVPIPSAYPPVFLIVNLSGIVSILFFSVSYVLRARNQLMRRLNEEHLLFTKEHEKTEKLLRNILPDTIAEKLKIKQTAISQAFPDASVLFADIAGFTRFASDMSAEGVVEMLNHIFSLFDILAEEYSLEKIKTIGDAYMAVGNLPKPHSGHLEAMADMALAMQEVFQKKVAGTHPLELRVGLHCGPVVAGVIGRRKFSYDLWGDTVNVAQRMESHGLPGRIQVSEEVYQRLNKRYALEERGMVDMKGKGGLKAYWLQGKIEGKLVLPNMERPRVGSSYF